jgi:hypothetical protein
VIAEPPCMLEHDRDPPGGPQLRDEEAHAHGGVA